MWDKAYLMKEDENIMDYLSFWYSLVPMGKFY